jgi:hypothetical protein
VELLHTVTTGASAYPRRYGRGFWNDLAADLVLQESFDDKMTRRFREQAPKIAEGFDWSRFRDIVDVGGGQGTLLASLAPAGPWSGVVAGGAGYALQDRPVSTRFEPARRLTGLQLA